MRATTQLKPDTPIRIRGQRGPRAHGKVTRYVQGHVEYFTTHGGLRLAKPEDVCIDRKAQRLAKAIRERQER